MYDYEDEKDYVKEIFWESKGLGGHDRPAVEPVVLTGKEIACPKCGRVSDEALIQRHLPKCSF
jgi:hypothetical protein